MTGSAAAGTLVALLLVACTAAVPASSPAGSTTAPVSPDAAPTSRPSPSPSPSTSPLPYHEVQFSAEGGPSLRGRVWSDGRIGVVLAHGFSRETGQDTWNGFAEFLAEEGYAVLTFDFRGFCDRRGCSEGSLMLGENWRDAAAAVEYLRSRGSERIFIVAASMGGLAAFRAADEANLDLAGIVSLATPQFPATYYFGEPEQNDVTPERLQRIEAPKLFVAGADDVQLPGTAPLKPDIESVRFAEDAQSMFQAAAEPKQLEIVDSAHHSSGLVTIADRGVVEHTRELIVAFIEEHA